MLIRRAVISGCAVALLACACSSSGSGTPDPTTSKPKSSTTKPTPTTSRSTVTTTPATGTGTTVTTVPPVALKDLILRDAGTGFILQPDEIAETGPTNIAKAANDEIDPKARKVLQVTGFVDGFQRQWKNIDDAGNTNNDFVFLYEFATPGGANFYAQNWRQSLVNTPHAGVPLTSFSPPEIPGSMGLSSSTKNGSTGVVIFSKGNYAVKALVNSVNLNRQPSGDQSGAATALALLQYQRIT